MDIRTEAHEILNKQILGVQSLGDAISSADFEEVVKLIADGAGKIVITGIGKSGHIACKISSTMSSLGIPSIFMHSSEACHGDLGVIQSGDIILLISNSGESKELEVVVNFCKSRNIKTVAITRGRSSVLSQTCDYKILISPFPEVIDFGAPTTSTTQTLVIGDILTVCAAKLRGFNKQNYAELHPSGNLGLSVTLVKNSKINTNTPIVFCDTPIKDAILEMSKNSVGFTAILDKNSCLAGILTDGDLRRALVKHESSIFDIAITEVMTKNPVTAKPDDSLLSVLDVMIAKRINDIVVIDYDGKILGFLSKKDLAR